MSLPVMLDVLIGLVGLFLALSLIASFLLEIYVGMFNRHGRLLRNAIGQLLGDPAGTGLAQQLYEHPLIQGLKSGARLPSSIPAPIFARAIVDLMDQSGASHSGTVAGVLRPMVMMAEGNREKLIKEIETWFDLGLQRMSGSIARRSQMWLIPIAAALTLGLNVNTVKVYEALSTQEALRQAAVTNAVTIFDNAGKVINEAPSDPALAETPAPAVEAAEGEGATAASDAETFAADKKRLEAQINAFSDLFGGLPMGWPCASPQEVLAKLGQLEAAEAASTEAPSTLACIKDGIAKAGYLDWTGWLVTIIAISFGAQFWYRILKSLIKIRSLMPSAKKVEAKAEAEAKA